MYLTRKLSLLTSSYTQEPNNFILSILTFSTLLKFYTADPQKLHSISLNIGALIDKCLLYEN